MNPTSLIAPGIIAIILLIIIFIFNKMIRLRNATKNTFSQIDILIRKRANIIKNIGIIITQETAHEKTTIEQITQLRTTQFTDTDLSQTTKELEKTKQITKQIFAIKENYPNLKSHKSFAKYIEEMTQAENEIMRMRHVYNNVIEVYNNYIQTFPNNIFAKIFNFYTKQYLEF